jgi:uncharacterized repeat protein (TIGR01451 family)
MKARAKVFAAILLALMMNSLLVSKPSLAMPALQTGISAPGPSIIIVHDNRYIPYHVPAPERTEPHVQAANITVNFNPASCPAANITPWPQNAMNAFNFTAGIWSSLINSNQVIAVDACWRSDLAANVLGSAGTATIHRDFTNAPVANTWYPAALANSLANSDLNGGAPDIRANFNSTFSWYFGTDGNTPASQVDFASVVLHEIGHGLGFFGAAAVNTGNGACGSTTVGDGCVGNAGFPIIYDRFTEDGNGTQLLNYASPSAALGNALTGNVGGIFFNGTNANAANGGAHVPLYAPTTWRPGSSYSHLAESFNNTPNALMTFSLGNGESQHSPGPVVLGIFRDIGWGLERANLSITKTSSATTVIAGTDLAYTLQIANLGPNQASNVTVTDSLPPNVTLVSASAGCSGTVTLTCNLGALANGAAATVSIIVAVRSATPSGTILTNTASVSGNEVDPSLANNTASANTRVARQANLVIQKTDAPDPLILGSTLTYTISVSNSGPSDASLVTVTDTLPEHVVFVPGACAENSPGSGTVTCSMSSLANGASATFTIIVAPLPIIVVPNKTGVITNSATVIGAEVDPELVNNTIQGITTTVELPQTCNQSAPNVILGTSGDDLLIGTAGDDVIIGLGGDDQIFGREGNDCLDGSNGNDQISGDSGNDLIFGRSGKDVILGSDGDDLIMGDSGGDVITGSEGNDVIFGDASADQITGNDGEDLIVGGAGDDQIDSGAGNDRVFGGDGSDRVIGATGNDVVSGGVGSDRIAGNDGDDILVGDASGDQIDGGAGSDQISGGDSGDRLTGGTGNDILKGDLGNDRLKGNAGDDQLDGGLDQDLLDGGSDIDSCLNGEELIKCE